MPADYLMSAGILAYNDMTIPKLVLPHKNKV